MPLQRIDLHSGRPAEQRRAIADAVHRALVETIGVPPDDRFQVISEHPQGGTPESPLEEKIYGTMTENAYVILRDKFLATILPTSAK